MEERTVYYVTGATGWVGHELVMALLRRGAEVVIFVLPGDRMISLYDDLRDKVDVVIGDVTRKEDCERFLAEKAEGAAQRVIHCAGIISVSGKFSKIVYDVNVTGTKNMADAALARNVAKFVYVSTSHALRERPKREVMTESFDYETDVKKGNYAVTKALATEYVINLAKKGLNSVVIHPTAVIGPGDTMLGYMTSMFRDFLAGNLPASVNGAYDLVDVRDLAELLIAAADKGRKGNNYLASGTRIKITDLIDMIAKLENRRKVKVTFPFWFVKLVAPAYERNCRRKGRKALYTKYSLIAMQSNSRFSSEKAKRELGFAPRPLEESVRDTAEYVKTIFPECREGRNIIKTKKTARKKKS